jgi:hypothetical protein
LLTYWWDRTLEVHIASRHAGDPLQLVPVAVPVRHYFILTRQNKIFALPSPQFLTGFRDEAMETGGVPGSESPALAGALPQPEKAGTPNARIRRRRKFVRNAGWRLADLKEEPQRTRARTAEAGLEFLHWDCPGGGS